MTAGVVDPILLHDHRGELLALARRIYRHGRENNIN